MLAVPSPEFYAIFFFWPYDVEHMLNYSVLPELRVDVFGELKQGASYVVE